MKYAAGVAVVVLLIAAVPVYWLLRPDRGYEAVVSGVEQQYHAQPEHIPLQWFASLCATVSTHGGVRHLRMAQFDHVNGLETPDELTALLASRLGPPWQRIILNRDGTGQMSVIYAHPEGRAMSMLIASYDHGQLNLVRMDVNGSRLARFVQNPKHAPGHGVVP